MSRAKDEIGTLLRANGGVIARKQHPDLAGALERLVRTGELCSVLPGVYAPAAWASDPRVKMRATMAWAPDAVITGAAAASVSFWLEIKVPVVSVALRRQSRARVRGFEFSRSRIPEELVETRAGLRFSTPALTALQLCDALGGDGIDTVLRTRAARLEDLYRAIELTKGFAGNMRRRTLLLESRDNPWSRAERLCHQLLRQAGITGWQANVKVRGAQQWYFLDVAFEDHMLAVEIDGRLHEDDGDLFETDRSRQNYLVLQGWRVLRFTWKMLTQQPDVVIQTILAALNSKR